MIRAILTITYELRGVGPANNAGQKQSAACYFEGAEDGSMDEKIESAAKETIHAYMRASHLISHCLVMCGEIYGGNIVYVDMNDRSVHDLNSTPPSA